MKNLSLSSLEENVIDIVWRLENCSIREIKNNLDKSKRLAYTTVATIAWRLEEKGALARTIQNSKIYYCPKISKEDYSRKITSSFFRKLHNSFGNMALVSFAESLNDLPKEEKNYLYKLLKESENK